MRPNRLLFEWDKLDNQGDPCRLIVKGDKGQLFCSSAILEHVRSMKQLTQVQDVREINMPMSGAAGWTQGMSDTVLPLLIANSGRPCFAFNRLAFFKMEDVNGMPCYRLREIYSPTHIWIAEHDFTIQKFVDESSMPFPLGLVFDSARIGLATFGPRLTKDSNEAAEFAKLKDSPDLLECTFTKVSYNHLADSDLVSCAFKSQEEWATSKSFK